jgi:hypothetical protein
MPPAWPSYFFSPSMLWTDEWSHSNVHKPLTTHTPAITVHTKGLWSSVCLLCGTKWVPMFQRNLLPTVFYPEEGGSRFFQMFVLKSLSTQCHNSYYHNPNFYLKSQQEQHPTQSAKVHSHNTVQSSTALAPLQIVC